MARKKKTADKPTTRYTVQSVNTGAKVCGPYDNVKDANRECERLNREATRGRTDPSEPYPTGQALALPQDPQLMHGGVRQGYEVVTGEGVILAD